MEIPLCIPYVDDKEISNVVEVLKSGWYAHGPKNKEFEQMFADKIGTKYALSLNSCTSALELSLITNEIKGEVITPSFTFVATANAIVTSGSTPVFVDINSDDGMINTSLIESSITKNTEAIIAVHFGGSVSNMEEICRLSEKYGLLLIEDSAETIGGKYKDKYAGSFGLGCFSFYPTKNITTGEGGMLTTNDDKVYRKAKALIGHGIEKSAHDRETEEKPWQRSATYPGYNYRLTNFQAAMGIEQLKKLDEINGLRRKHSFYLTERLSTMKEINLMLPAKDIYHVFQMFTIRVDAKLRTKFVNHLRKNNISASVHFDPPVHLQSYYSNNYKNLHLPNTEKLASEIVTLPMYPQLTEENLDYMVEIIDRFFNE